MLPWEGESVPFDALCAGAPEFATSILVGLLRAAQYVPGAPSAEREARSAKLAAELAEAEAAEVALVDELISTALAVDHRPEVLSQRAEAEAARKREAEAVAEREAALDARVSEVLG